MQTTIRGLKTWKTDDGGGYQFALYLDGVIALEVENDGTGGPMVYNVITPSLVGKWAAQFADCQNIWLNGGTLRCDSPLDLHICELLDEYERARRLKRVCAKKTLFRKPGETYREGEYDTVLAPFSPKVKAYLSGKYGEGVSILNETL